MSAGIGRAALTIGGAFIGNIIAPGIGGAIGTGLGAFVGSQLFPPEFPNETVTQPLLGDLSVQTSTYGNAIPFLWGTARIAGNVIWATDIIPQRHSQTLKQGGGKGGGGGPQRTNVTFTYSVSLAIGLCRGPVTGVRRIYADKAIIFDPENPTLDDALIFKFHNGSTTQEPDPNIEADIGVGLTPAYRGLAYLVMAKLQLDRFNNRVPNFSFEVVQGGTKSIPSTQIGDIDSAGKIAFDPETRLIWTPEKSQDRIRVINGSTMTILHTISQTEISRKIEYTPGYVLVSSSLLGGVSITEQAPQMHVGSDQVGLFLARVTRIDTHTYQKSTYIPDESSATFSPQTPVFHWGTVTLEGPNFTKPRISIIAGDQLSNIVYLQAHPGVTGAANAIRLWNDSTTTNVEEHVSFGDRIYLIGFTNQVQSFDDEGILQWEAEPAGGNADGAITYHEDVDAIFTVSGQATLSKIDKDNGTILFAVTYTDRVPLDVKYHKEIGDLWMYARDTSLNSYMMRIDPDNGDLLEELLLDFGAGVGPEHALLLYPGAPFAFIVNTLGNFRRTPLFEFPGETTVTVRTIVDEIFDECGIDSTLRDTTALAALTVKGFAIASNMTGRQGLEPILRALLVDFVESDDVLKAVLRGGSSSATILEEDMGAAQAGGDTNETLQITRGDETELPNEISVVYSDQDFDYNRGTQSDRRLITRSLSRRAINVPVVMTATKARQLASVFLQNVWRERDAMQWSTTIKHIEVEPTDVITLQLKDGLTFTVRVTRVQYSPPALMDMRGFREDASVYIQLTPGVPTLVAQRIAEITVPTILNILDIQLLRDEDEDAGFYIASAGPYAGWKVADLFESSDEGGTYRFKQLLTKEAIYGFAVTTLATTARPYVWDDINTVDIEMTNGSISSSTDASVLAFGNMALLGNEIIQFVNVTALGGGVFRLSRLLRGRQGSDTAVPGHGAFERFVLLTENTVDRVPLGVSQINVARTLKAVSQSMTLSQTYPRFFTPTAKGLFPYNPEHLKGIKISGDDLTITWFRRARVVHGWLDSIDVQLDEDTENYEIDILDAPGGNVVNTFSTTAPTFVYTGAQQITDFGSVQTTFNVVIFQLSSFAAINNSTRRGFPAVAQFVT